MRSAVVMRVGVGEIHLELAVGVLMIDLVDIDADRLHALDQPLDEDTAARESLVVVARFVEQVGAVRGREAAVLRAANEHELRLHAGVQRPAPFLQAGDLLLEDIACIERPDLSFDATVADDACKTRLPRDERQGRQIADCHVIRVVRFLTKPPDGKTSEASTVGENVLEMTGRHRLGLRHPVNVDELRQDEFDLVLGEKCFGFLRSHGVDPFRKSW